MAVFSAPEQTKILQTFHEHFQLHLKSSENFSLRSVIDEEKVVIRLELADVKRDEVLTMECATDVESKNLTKLLLIRTQLVEFLYVMLDEYFRGDRWPRPNLDWKEYEHEDKIILFRGSVVAERLEQMADAFLEKSLKKQDFND